MRRGFKAEAERISIEARRALDLDVDDLLDPWTYAAHLGIVVLDFDTLDTPEAHKRQLTMVDPESWSGLTLKIGETLAIVLNPSHADTRNRNTLMHEIAHALLRHPPARVDVSVSGLLLLSHYSDEHEDEADWLAGALLMPRETLLTLRGQGMSVPALAAHFGISHPLCEWRLRMTGIDTQLRRSRR